MPYSGSSGPYSAGEPTSLVDASLGELDNVDTSGKVEGSTLYYDATTSKWKAHSNIHYDDANNRVGIGTITPEKLFHIKGDQAPTLRITDTPNDTRLDLACGDTSATIETFSNHPLLIGTNNQERMRITEGGDVGIGTITPSTKLDVSGTGTVAQFQSDNTNSFIGLKESGGSFTYLGNKAGTFAIQTAGGGYSDKLTITSGGDVAVGSHTAGTTLHVNRGGDGNLLTLERGTGGYFISSGFNSSDPYLTYYGTSGLTLGYGSGTHNVPSVNTMTLANNGNVGIATSSPEDSLHIEGVDAVISTTQLTLEGSYNGYGAGVDFVSRTSSGGTRLSMAKITADGESSWNTTSSTQNAGLRFFTTSAGSQAERMRINNLGNIGINNTSPAVKLDVNGDIQTNTKLILPTQGVQTIDMGSWSSFGEEQSHNALLIGNNAIVNGATSEVEISTGDGYRAIKMKFDEGITFHAIRASVVAGDTLTYERMRISPNGNVGIANANPQVKLDVSGSIRGATEVVNLSSGLISAVNCYGDTIYADTATGTLTLPAGVVGMNLYTINASGGTITLAVTTGDYLDDTLNGTDNLAISGSKPYIHKVICGATGKWYILH